VVANARGYFDQLMRILDPDRVEVVNNADWLSRMQVAEMLDYTRQLTVAQLLERDDFARRFAAKLPITLSEFFYPLLQGIDSVEVRADIELGGTDQTFNNLVGRELQKSRGQAPQVVITVPLLVGTDGVEKMGKSLNNYIAINDSAEEQFGKLMSIPDSVVVSYAQLCTTLRPREIEEVEGAVAAGGKAANIAKRRVAREVVALYHGVAEATAAEARFDRIFRDREPRDDAPEFALPDADPVHLPAILVGAGLAPSSSAARRLIDERGVRLNGSHLEPRRYDVPAGQLAGKVLAVGKRRAVRLVRQGD
jgi:tyrosyl-tRNA synthetase